jgi:hypothetical protein
MEDQSTFREFCVVAIIIGQLLQNICITDDHGYVPFVMNTVPPFYPVIHLFTVPSQGHYGFHSLVVVVD